GSKFFMRQRNVVRLHRGFGACQSSFALRYSTLPTVNLPLGNGIHILGKAGRANERYRKNNRRGNKPASAPDERRLSGRDIHGSGVKNSCYSKWICFHKGSLRGGKTDLDWLVWFLYVYDQGLCWLNIHELVLDLVQWFQGKFLIFSHFKFTAPAPGINEG